MRYVAAYLLASLAGNENPTTKDIEKIIGSVGIECEPEKLALVMKQLKGKDVEELIKQGQEKLATAPGIGTAAVTSAAPEAEEKVEEKKEEKQPEPESDSDDDMGFGLFD